MKLRLVMFLVLGPLSLFIAVLLVRDINLQQNTLALAHEATVRSGEAAIIGAVVHELQKERGYSAGYIASKGRTFPAELKTQRADTMNVIQSYRAGLNMLKTEHPKLFDDINQRLNELTKIRGQVDSFGLSVPEMAGVYTKTINLLIELSRPTTSSANSGKLQSYLSARAMIGSAKENAGLERAKVAAGLSGGFSLKLHDQFVTFLGAQNALLYETSSILGGNAWLADLFETNEYKSVRAARDTVKSGYETGNFKGLTPGQWFKISTDWINLLRQRELELVSQVAALTETIESDANTSFQ